MSTTKRLTGLAKLSLLESGTSHWLELADLLRMQSDSRAEASQMLKAIWGMDDKPTYRSKIACFAHPQDLATFQRARNTGVKVGVEDLITLARGHARFDGKKVIRISKDRRGGSNRQPPQDRLNAQLQKAMKQATAAGVLRKTAERLCSMALDEAFEPR